MPRTPLNQIASIVATSTLGVVFLTAAASKTIDPAVTLSAFVYMLPTEPGYAATLTRVLIAMEFVLAGLLLFRVAPLRTILAAFAVLVVFTGWLVNLNFGISGSAAAAGSTRNGSHQEMSDPPRSSAIRRFSWLRG